MGRLLTLFPDDDLDDDDDDFPDGIDCDVDDDDDGEVWICGWCDEPNPITRRWCYACGDQG